MKSRLIIVEGPQGAGKTTITNMLREKIPSTNLIRMSGVSDKTITGKEKSYLVHMEQLQSIFKTRNCGINYVLDRSIISEALYGYLGYKPYSTEDWADKFWEIFLALDAAYDLEFIFLNPNKETIERRLDRDKAEYQEFSVENSLNQGKMLEKLFSEKNPFMGKKIIKFDGNLISEEIVNSIINRKQ